MVTIANKNFRPAVEAFTMLARLLGTVIDILARDVLALQSTIGSTPPLVWSMSQKSRMTVVARHRRPTPVVTHLDSPISYGLSNFTINPNVALVAAPSSLTLAFVSTFFAS